MKFLDFVMSAKTQYLFSQSIANLLKSLFKPVCLICGFTADQTVRLCQDCKQKLPNLPQNCYQCGRLLVEPAELSLPCGYCLTHSPPFDLTFSLFPYLPPIINLIKHLKFNQVLSNAHFFADLFKLKVPQWYHDQPLPNLLIPVPLHSKRLRERGFNQALEIAKPIAKALKIKLDAHSLIRIKATLAQSHLNAKERKQNIKRAFCTHKRYDGLTIAVLDDVITTGHTMREICTILKNAGAKTIHVWCCALNSGSY
jgi:ComF family protein